MADAYKVLQDTSLPMPIRTVTTVDGVEVEETTGVAYRAGDYVLPEELTKAVSDAVEDGELRGHAGGGLRRGGRDLPERGRRGCSSPSTRSSAGPARTGQRMIERDQLLGTRSAGCRGRRSVMSESQEGPNDTSDALSSANRSSRWPTSRTVAERRASVRGRRGQAGGGRSEEDLIGGDSSSVAGVEMPPGPPGRQRPRWLAVRSPKRWTPLEAEDPRAGARVRPAAPAARRRRSPARRGSWRSKESSLTRRGPSALTWDMLSQAANVRRWTPAG